MGCFNPAHFVALLQCKVAQLDGDIADSEWWMLTLMLLPEHKHRKVLSYSNTEDHQAFPHHKLWLLYVKAMH